MSKELILLKTVKKLGKVGDIVTVSKGYAKNYLIPQNIAVISNKDNKLNKEKRSKILKAETDKLLSKAKEMTKSISNKYYEIIRNTMHDGRLYGSLSARDLSRLISTDLCKVNSNNIIISDTIKHSGVHKITIELYPDILSENVFVAVASSKDEINKMIDKHKSTLLCD